jgi:hypothetical protein
LLVRRVLLEQGDDEEGALAALHGFADCADFDIDFLYLAALVRAHMTACADADAMHTSSRHSR